MCKEGGSDELVTRAFNQMSKLYQRCISVSNQSQTSNVVLLVVILFIFKIFHFAGTPVNILQKSLKKLFWDSGLKY